MPIYLEAYDPKEDDFRGPVFLNRHGSVISSGDWKLHQYFEYGGLELYNLKDDPSEMNILASSNPKKFQELLQKLVKWRTDHGAPIPTTKVPD